MISKRVLVRTSATAAAVAVAASSDGFRDTDDVHIEHKEHRKRTTPKLVYGVRRVTYVLLERVKLK